MVFQSSSFSVPKIGKTDDKSSFLLARNLPSIPGSAAKLSPATQIEPLLATRKTRGAGDNLFLDQDHTARFVYGTSKPPATKPPAPKPAVSEPTVGLRPVDKPIADTPVLPKVPLKIASFLDESPKRNDSIVEPSAADIQRLFGDPKPPPGKPVARVLGKMAARSLGLGLVFAFVFLFTPAKVIGPGVMNYLDGLRAVWPGETADQRLAQGGAGQVASGSGQVKGLTTDFPNSQRLVISLPTVFKEAVTTVSLTVKDLLNIEGDVEIGQDLTVNGDTALEGDTTMAGAVEIAGNVDITGNTTLAGTLTLNGDVTGNDIDIDIGSGSLTAGNVVYSVSAGSGISISGGTQNPTITNTDLGSSQKIFKTITDGLTSFSAGTNTDTLTFEGDDGVTVTADAVNQKLIITADGAALNVSGFTDDGTAVRLTTSTDSLGVGTDTPTSKLHVVGTTALVGNTAVTGTFGVTGNTTLTGGFEVTGNSLLNGDLTVMGSTDLRGGTVIANGINNSLGGITNTGAITGATGLTSSGTITFSGLSTGIVKSSLGGVLSSAAVDLASADVTGVLGVANGGVGLSSYTAGDLIYASATNTLSPLHIGGEGEVLTVASGTLAWGSITGSGGLCPNCLVNNPGSTQAITPTSATTTGLSVRQASGGSVDIFNVTSTDGNTKYLRVDSAGNVALGSGSVSSSGNLTVGPSNTDPISISPVAQGVAAYTGTLTSEDLTALRTWTLPDSSGVFCLTTGNCNGVGGNFGGSGTINYLAKFSSSTTVANSLLYDDGTSVGIGDATPTYTLDVNGTGRYTGALTADSTFHAAGAATFGSTLQTTGAASFLSTLNVTGAATFSDSVSITGAITGGSTLAIAGNATIGTNALFVDATNKKIGIGTITPTAIVHAVSTSTSPQTNGMGYFDWSPTAASTLTGDLVAINVGANGTVGNIFNIQNNGSSVFSVSQSKITASLPIEFNAPGDVGIAYDLQFTNQTASAIKSLAPLTVEVGESFESNDLTLRTFNAGDIVADLTGTGKLIATGTDTSMIFDTRTATDTDFWMGIQDDAGGDDDDTFQIGDGTVPGTNPFLTINTSGYVGIGDVSPSAPLEVGNGTDSLQISATGDITFVDADGAASITGPAGGTLTLAAGAAQDLALTAADDLTFDDAQLTSALNLSVADTALNVALTQGIVDAINDLYDLSTAGGGSSMWSTAAGVVYPTSATNDLAIGGLDATAPFFFDESAELLTLTNITAGNSFVVNDEATDTTPFVIDASGNVGIGIVTPNYKLDVSAAAASDSSFALSDADVAHGLTTLATTGTYGLFQPISSTAGGTQFTALSDADAQALSIRGIIGSTDPTDTTPAIKLVGAKSDGSTGMADLGATETVFQVANNDDTAGLTMLGNGNVGIGTVSPAAKLHLNGSMIMNLSNAIYFKNAAGAGSSGLSLHNSATQLDFREESTSKSLMSIQGGGNIGIGTTAPDKAMEINSATGANLRLTYNDANGSAANYADFSTSSSGDLTIAPSGGDTNFTGNAAITSTDNAAAALSLTNNTATTIGAGVNTLGVIDLQSTSLTTGNFMNLETNALTTGKALNVTSTSTALTTGSLGVFDWSPTSATTATGDLVSLNVGANGTVGNIFNIKNNGSSVFSVSQSQIAANLPMSFNAPGDIAAAYDLQFTNQTASYIKSKAPLYLEAGESFESNDLTLRTFNSGNLILDIPAGDVLFNGTGQVGIGTLSPSYPLHVSRADDGDVAGFTDSNGTCTINPTSTALSCSSDQNLKKNIVTLPDTLAIVKNMRGVTFNWKTEAEGAAAHIGFIAQEVEAVAPSLVTTNDKGIKSVNYVGFVPILAQAMNEQQDQILGLSTEVATQQALLAGLNLSANGLIEEPVFAAQSEVAALAARVAELETAASSSTQVASGSGAVVVGASELDQPTGLIGRTTAALAQWADTTFTFLKDVVIQGTATFENLATFRGPVAFLQETLFQGRVIFGDRDTVGVVEFYPGEYEADVIFEHPYDFKPIVTLTAEGDLSLLTTATLESQVGAVATDAAHLARTATGSAQVVTSLPYRLENVTAEGFRVVLTQPATNLTTINWHALATQAPNITQARAVAEEPGSALVLPGLASGSGEVAGATTVDGSIGGAGATATSSADVEGYWVNAGQ